MKLPPNLLNKKSKIGVTIIASLVVLTPLVALAGNRFERQVKEQLIQVLDKISNGGYRPSHDPVVNSLRDDSYRNGSISLDSGESYAIIGVCDEDCHDLDLHLYDGNGHLVDSDTSSDDTPIVQVSPRWSGSFRVKVSMPGCSDSPCYYGIGVFSR